MSGAPASKKVIERKITIRHFYRQVGSFMRTRKKTNLILTPVKPIPERKNCAYQPVNQANKKIHPAQIGIALKAVVDDGGHGCAD